MPWGARKAVYLGIVAIFDKGVTNRYIFRRIVRRFFLGVTRYRNFAAMFRDFFWAFHVTRHFRRDFSRFFFWGGYTLQPFRRMVRRNPDRHFTLQRNDRGTMVDWQRCDTCPLRT